MSKNIKSLTEVDAESIETTEEVPVENKTVEVSKPKWSLKKKLLIGGGVVAGLVLGVITLGCKKSDTPVDDEAEDSDVDDVVAEATVTESDETPANVEE